MENRVIKFRAFNKKTNGMIYSDQTDQERFEDQMVVFFSSMVLGLDYGSAELTYMQFTGLLDKHGKEIYEGDVLHSKSWGSTSEINPYHVVNRSGCGWKAQGYNGKMKVNPDLDVKSDFEVIGNIYENPDLINS